MNPAAIAPNAVSFVLSALLATGVLCKRQKSTLHWVLLAMLTGIALWTGGAVLRHQAAEFPELMRAFRVMFAGVVLVPPLWLLLAAQFTRKGWVEEHPGWSAALLAPAPLFYGLFLSTGAHGLFADITLERFVYGPGFWAMVGWAWLCVAAGITLFLARARWMEAHADRLHATLLAAAALVPGVLNASYLGGLASWSYDPTPAALGLSTALMFPVIFRFRMLGGLPLLRRDVIEYLRDGVIIADAEGRVLDVNPAAAAMLDGTAEELRGQPLDACIAALALPGERRVAELALREAGAPGGPSNSEILTRSGRRLRISAPVVQGGPTGRFVVLQDRTEERRSERALRRAQKLESVGFLAAGIAHEVNNPLAFVRANLGLLARSGDLCKELARRAPPDQRDDVLEIPELVGESLEGIERIAQVVASMRRLSRDAGEEEALVDVNAALRESAKLAQLARGFGTPRVEMELDEALPAIRGSRDGLIQAFLNLLLNAKQALAEREDGRVRVVSRPARDGVEVVIEDDGPGVAPELHDRIFDPFFTTKGPDEGTGLGLSIAYDIVRENRGLLDLDSQPGEGARFIVWLPRGEPGE